jgi:LCP family protein required for cell wall assembly
MTPRTGIFCFLTQDGPETVEPPDDAPTEQPPTRHDLQTELRRSHKKERRHKHRWRRRLIYALSSLVLIAALGAGGLYLYINYRYDQIKKIHSKHLVTQAAAPSAPFNILLVGSDTRAFVQNAVQQNAYGSAADQGGQRSDVTMVARFDPAAKTVTVLSIPRDLWVDIPGNVGGVSGMNRINSAYNNGPDLLIQTIEHVLGIPINHFVAVDFPGFQGMVDALGGITMDFPTEVKDQYSGLHITTPGCQMVNGATALELVRARHLYYLQNGYWNYDGESDISRIQRQDAFFRAVVNKLGSVGLNPFTINSFIGAAVGNMTIDDTLTKNDLFNIATEFRGLPSSHFVTETLPTIGYVTGGGADVLEMAQPYAFKTITAFNSIGAPVPPSATVASRGHATSTSTTTTTTTVPTEAHGLVNVTVLNASTVNGLAHIEAAAIASQGFHVSEIGDAATPLASGTSQILYGPSGKEAALTLASVLTGPVTTVADPNLNGQDVSLLVASAALRVTAVAGASAPGKGSPASTTTVPAVPAPTTTTTTIPADVYTNSQIEPWNPYPCTLGAPAPASPKTATTTPKKKD